MFSWIFRTIRTAFNGDRLSPESVELAIDLIEKRGFKAHKYFAGNGSHDDSELIHALVTLEAAGFIVTDSDGRLVGKVATRRLGSEDIANQRRAEFRIVE